MWTRELLKRNAKEIFKRNYWTCVGVSLVLAALTGGGSSVIGRIGGNNTSVSYHHYGSDYYYGDSARGFMISADNAHAVHPNHPELADPVNKPVLNGGIVIKYNANRHYATDGFTAARFRRLCQTIHIPVQVFTNRSDMAGGSTLGHISNTRLAMPTVDIGLPQLAMHSSYETCGVKDTSYLVDAVTAFFDHM